MMLALTMTEHEAEQAHQASERFQQCIIDLGMAQLSDLTAEQREYVLRKAADEFRFWRINDAILRNAEKI